MEGGGTPCIKSSNPNSNLKGGEQQENGFAFGVTCKLLSWCACRLVIVARTESQILCDSIGLEGGVLKDNVGKAFLLDYSFYDLNICWRVTKYVWCVTISFVVHVCVDD